MKRRTQKRRFGFEQLEGRRLLAADFAMQAMPELDSIEPAQCEIVALACPVDDIMADPNTELTADSDAEPEGCDEGKMAVEVEPRALDLTDGMDGYFGSLNTASPLETFEFTSTGDGTVDVVLASSFGNSHASLSVTGSQGNVMETQSEGLKGFDVLTFEVSEGESYQVSVTTDDVKCEGNFQLTAGFSAHVDQHAEAMGVDSTELEFVDNHSELSGRFESVGDIDTFRFTATADGETTLELYETVDDARMAMGVSVHDSEGNRLAEGATNEMLQITFDVTNGQEYFVSLAAGEGATGTYQFDLNVEPNLDLPSAEIDVCDEFEEVVEPETAEPEICETDSATTEQETELASDQVDTCEEPAEIVEAEDVVVDPGLVANCETNEEDSEVVDPTLAEEPTNELVNEIVDQPGDVLPGDPADCELTDTNDPTIEPVVEPIAEPEVETVSEPSLEARVDCGDADSTVGEDTESIPEQLVGLEDDTLQADLVGGECTELVEEVIADEPILCIAELDAVDDFFSELGDELDFHFEFSFHRPGVGSFALRI